MYILSENKEIQLITSLQQAIVIIVLTIIFLFFTPNAYAFNEFQNFIEQKSKKQLNCTYCHNHINGPEGREPGQLDTLTEEEKQLTAYNQFLNANKELVNSPILNEFGNYLVKKIGYEAIVNAQNDPNQLIDKLKDSDLDQDGISDSEELTDGTLPSDPFDGHPFKLFINNLKKNLLEIIFQIVAILLFVFSLIKILKRN